MGQGSSADGRRTPGGRDVGQDRGGRDARTGRGRPRVIVLPPHPGVVRRARGLVEEMCRAAAVDQDTRETAVLLVSETVTNAVVHGGGDTTLAVSETGGVVRVEVGDEDSRAPRLGPHDPHALSGRGLEIVRLLARRWGVRDRPPGKVVWFEVG